MRIIPALAGNTTPRSRSTTSRRDHPRSRGEYRCGAPLLTRPEGSSPLSRGIRCRGCARPPTTRIIPALAGNTQGFVTAYDITADHPRSRGEYIRSRKTSILGKGSSPLSRGIHLSRRGSAWRASGSSPLSRGIRLTPDLWGRARRIIPALAGNTAGGCRGCRRGSDHPRSRGEYDGVDERGDVAVGSSPLSRGIPSPLPPLPRRRRIIPALAGNTYSGPRVAESE